MLTVPSLATAQRAVVAAMAVSVPLVYTQHGVAGVQAPKFALVLTGAWVLAVFWGLRVGLGRAGSGTAVSATIAVTLFVAALVVSTAAAPNTWLAIQGQYGRYSGLALYVAVAAVLLTVAQVYDGHTLRGLLQWLFAGGLVMTVYALAQWLGVDPIGWEVIYSPVVATMGNPNFVAGYLGVMVPLAGWAALDGSHSRRVRVASAVWAVGAFAAATLSGSLQGPAVALGGLYIVLIAWLADRPDPLRRRGLYGAAAAGVIGVGTVGASLAGIGPGAAFLASGALTTRDWYWTAAWRMFVEHPWLGVGMDHYGSYYRLYRPMEATLTLGLRDTADAPHNVLLGMFAGGGLILGLAYLGVLGVVAFIAVRGFRSLRCGDRFLLSALTAGWAASVAQSLVSIDVPPLALLQWLLAGAVLAAAVPVAEVPPPAGPSRKSKRAPAPPRVPAWALGVAGIAAVLGAWQFSRPWRAELHAAASVDAAGDGVPVHALGRILHASDVVPWEGAYHAQRAHLLLALDDLPAALEAYEQAISRSPRSLGYHISAARIAAGLGDDARAKALYERGLELDPTGREHKAEYAQYLLRQGESRRAIALLKESVAVREDPDMLVWLALALDDAGRREEAREALDRALKLAPQNSAALEVQQQWDGTAT